MEIYQLTLWRIF